MSNAFHFHKGRKIAEHIRFIDPQRTRGIFYPVVAVQQIHRYRLVRLDIHKDILLRIIQTLHLHQRIRGSCIDLDVVSARLLRPGDDISVFRCELAHTHRVVRNLLGNPGICGGIAVCLIVHGLHQQIHRIHVILTIVLLLGIRAQRLHSQRAVISRNAIGIQHFNLGSNQRLHLGVSAAVKQFLRLYQQFLCLGFLLLQLSFRTGQDLFRSGQSAGNIVGRNHVIRFSRFFNVISADQRYRSDCVNGTFCILKHSLQPVVLRPGTVQRILVGNLYPLRHAQCVIHGLRILDDLQRAEIHRSNGVDSLNRLVHGTLFGLTGCQ